MTNFRGIKQVKRATFDSIKNDADKLGYLWLVNNGTSENPSAEYDLYFGTRKYGSDASKAYEFINKVITTFGGLLDNEGGFIFPVEEDTEDFINVDESKVTNLYELLKALDAAIAKKLDTSSYNSKVTELQNAIDKCLTGVNVVISETETITGAVENGIVTIDLKGAFEAAGKVKGVTVDGNEVEINENGIVDIDLNGKADVSSVNAISGRVDALELIKHATDVKYDIDSKRINLYAGNEVLGGGFDAAPFLVDGMLKSVEFVKDAEGENTTILRFTFNTDGGDNVLDVDFSEYVDTYHADGTSLKLDSATNTFSVNEVDASKTKLTEDITIAGGPLANNVIETGDEWPWKDEAGNKIIPSGKSMEEILTGLFLKVIDGTVEWGNASWSPSLNNPTITLSSNGPVEVGSKVKVSTLTAGAATAGSRSATCECTQGYFLADADGNPTDEHVSGNKTISVNASITGTPTLTCTWNGNPVDISVNTTELVVEEGKNTISVSQSGQSATCDALPTTKVFAATNTKSLLSDVSATFSEDKPSDKPLTSSNTDTINAYYPIYTNGVKGSNGTASSETTLVANDGTKLPLVADSTAFYVNFAPMIDGGTGYRLLVKKGKTITEAMALNTLNSKYEVDMKSSFVKASTTVNKASGDSEIEYDVYESKGSAGANALRFKID